MVCDDDAGDSFFLNLLQWHQETKTPVTTIAAVDNEVFRLFLTDN